MVSGAPLAFVVRSGSFWGLRGGEPPYRPRVRWSGSGLLARLSCHLRSTRGLLCFLGGDVGRVGALGCGGWVVFFLFSRCRHRRGFGGGVVV